MKEVIREVNNEGSKKLLAVLKSSKEFSSVVWGLHGEFYVLRGKLEKVSGKAIFDSDENICKIIAQTSQTEITSADFSFSSQDHKENVRAREAFISMLNKVLGIKKNSN